MELGESEHFFKDQDVLTFFCGWSSWSKLAPHPENCRDQVIFCLPLRFHISWCQPEMLKLWRINDGCLNREWGTDTVAETKKSAEEILSNWEDYSAAILSHLASHAELRLKHWRTRWAAQERKLKPSTPQLSHSCRTTYTSVDQLLHVVNCVTHVTRFVLLVAIIMLPFDSTIASPDSYLCLEWYKLCLTFAPQSHGHGHVLWHCGDNACRWDVTVNGRTAVLCNLPQNCTCVDPCCDCISVKSWGDSRMKNNIKEQIMCCWHGCMSSKLSWNLYPSLVWVCSVMLQVCMFPVLCWP